MEERSHASFIVLATLLAATCLSLAMIGDVRLRGEAGIQRELPDKVGDWHGKQVLHCQNEQCAAAFLAAAGGSPARCKICGSDLAGMSVGEARLLPSGTDVLRKQYVDPAGRLLTASVVVMGTDRTAIHNPMVCLRAQGYRIAREREVAVPIADRTPLHLTLLDLTRVSHLPDGVSAGQHTGYAYWFVGKGRESASRLHMFLLMGMDRLFLNRSDRWAYVSVVTNGRKSSEDHVEVVSSFVSSLYPLLILAE
ncbi:MAG: exosortase-associated EpsI family protein [Lentisphaerae bacterium]|nr:exosortase-associated EpsI family protein [Lentisphaerota bacterium]